MAPLQVELVNPRKRHHHFLAALHKKYKNMNTGTFAGIIFVAALVVVAIFLAFRVFFSSSPYSQTFGPLIGENFGGTQGKQNMAFATFPPSSSSILPQTNAAGAVTGWNFVPATNYSGQVTMQYVLTPQNNPYDNTNYTNYITMNVMKTYNQMAPQSPFPTLYPTNAAGSVVSSIMDTASYTFTNQNLLDMAPMMVDDLGSTETHVSYVGYSLAPSPTMSTIVNTSTNMLTNNNTASPGSVGTESTLWTFQPPTGFIGTVTIYFWITNTGDASYASYANGSSTNINFTVPNNSSVNIYATASPAANQTIYKNLSFSFGVQHQYQAPTIVPVSMNLNENASSTALTPSFLTSGDTLDKYVQGLNWIVSGLTIGTPPPPTPTSASSLFNGNYYLKNSTSQYVYFTTATSVQSSGTFPVLTMVLQSTPGYPTPYNLTALGNNQYTIQYSTSSNSVTLCLYNSIALGFVTSTVTGGTTFTISQLANNYFQISATNIKGTTYCLDTSNTTTFFAACNSATTTQMFTFSTT